MNINRPKPFLPALLLVSSFLFSSPAAAAFETDELLLNDDEFEGSKTPDLDHVNPDLSPPTWIHRKPDLDSSSFSSDSKAIQFDLEHALSDSGFSPAGTFTARLKSWSHGGQTLSRLRVSRSALTGEEQKAFERLLKEDAFYMIRVASNVLNPAGKEYVVSSVRAD